MCGEHEFLPSRPGEHLTVAQINKGLMNRRRFLGTLGAASGLVLTGLAGCSDARSGRAGAAAPSATVATGPAAPAVPGLRPVDAVEVTIVVDGSLDYFVAPSDGVTRHPLPYEWTDHEQLIAEHGFCALVTTEMGGARTSVLYDGGLTPAGLRRNLSVLEVPVQDLRAITVSHGHADHHAGLQALFDRPGRLSMPLLIHPDAWRDRKIVFPTGKEIHMPPPSRADLEREGVRVVEERRPSLIVDEAFLVSGEVDRVTPYESGFSNHWAHLDGTWQKDPVIVDDQNLIVNVKNKGLVVVSGCSHSGVVNVLTNAQRLTGEKRIAGFIGGLHLSGPAFEPIIGTTTAALAQLGVGRVVPAHCTGWKAVHAIARQMPDAFIQPAVGTRIRF